MNHRPAPLLAFVALLAACTNSTVPGDWHRSRPVAEGRRPAGLPGQPVEPVYQPTAEAGSVADKDPRWLSMFDGLSASPLGWPDFIARAAHSDIVLVGEVHAQPAAQRALEALWEDLTQQAPTAWLAFEFFERDQQAALDDYLAGVSTEEEFRKATARTDSNYPPGHRTMLERAKSLGRPVIAANAPRRYARLARTAGFDRLQSLGPETQRLVALPQFLTEGPYRTNFESEIRESLKDGAHAASEKKEQADAARQGDTTAEPKDLEEKVQGYYRSQNLWDSTMADSITRPALAGARPVVLVVGQFHTDHFGGLTERARGLSPQLRVMTISLVDASPAEGATLRPEDANRADAVVYLK
jgi:uncharacterized iron-regulated protein